MKYKAFLGQDYEKLKLECLENKRLFEDDKFPANNYSLYRGKTSPFSSSIVWKRPHEFLDNPQFIIDNIHSSDLDQGKFFSENCKSKQRVKLCAKCFSRSIGKLLGNS